MSEIQFDDNGVCNYCRQIDSLVSEYGTGKNKGKKEFDKILNEIKKEGRGNKYDCVIGVSGGTDSSYLLVSSTNSRAIPTNSSPSSLSYCNITIR